MIELAIALKFLRFLSIHLSVFDFLHPISNDYLEVERLVYFSIIDFNAILA